MQQAFLAGFLLTMLAGVARSSGPEPPCPDLVGEVRPDPAKAHALTRWPDNADMARLQFVEGRSKAVILRVLGHPCRVERRPDGEEVWDYPWPGACRLWIRKGRCTGTFYTAGY
jgi:hypothetical protein